MSLLSLLRGVPTKGCWPGALTVQKAALEKGTRQGLVGQGQELGRGGTPPVALALQELCVMRNLHLAL